MIDSMSYYCDSSDQTPPSIEVISVIRGWIENLIKKGNIPGAIALNSMLHEIPGIDGDMIVKIRAGQEDELELPSMRKPQQKQRKEPLSDDQSCRTIIIHVERCANYTYRNTVSCHKHN